MLQRITSSETNVWRYVLEYFDAINLGLTATPPMHTISYFNKPVYRYTVNEAILEGFLVDYDAVNIKSNVKIKGVFPKEGEHGRFYFKVAVSEKEFT